MFESPGPEALAAADDTVVVDAIGGWDRGENAAAARRLAAIGELVARRCPAEGADPRSGRWAGQSKTECGLHAS